MKPMTNAELYEPMMAYFTRPRWDVYNDRVWNQGDTNQHQN